MNIVEILTGKILLALRLRKFKKAFAKDFPGKSKDDKELELHFKIERETILLKQSSVLVDNYAEISI
jgi:hypothetical protein